MSYLEHYITKEKVNIFDEEGQFIVTLEENYPLLVRKMIRDIAQVEVVPSASLEKSGFKSIFYGYCGINQLKKQISENHKSLGNWGTDER